MIGQSGVDVDVEQVTVGMTVLALDLEEDTTADLQDVKGGIVVAVIGDVDPDTGEIQRAFITAKQWRREVRFSHLRSDQVRDVLPFDAAAARRLVRALARTVADTKGVLLTDQRRAIDAMAALKEIA